MLVELTGGSYNETGTGYRAQLSEAQSLSAAVNLADEDLMINVTPLTAVAAALAGNTVTNYSSTQEAVDAANELISKIYSVDVLNTAMIDISDNANATGVCTDDYRHSFVLAGLSKWTSSAAEENGAYSQNFYNSVLLAEKMAIDISDDGLLNGGQSFGAVPIDGDVYRGGFGNAIIEAIDDSYINATKLKTEDYLGIEQQDKNTGYASVISNTTFASRYNLYGYTAHLKEIVVENRNYEPMSLRIENIGDPTETKHSYYDARKVHVVQEKLTYEYRGRNVSGSSYGQWRTINSYDTYEDGGWAAQKLPSGHTIQFEHPSDTLPDNITKGWHYFINERLGEMFTISVVMVQQGLFDAAFGDCRIAKGEYACWKGGRFQGSPPTPDTWQDETVTPEIQQSYEYTYTTYDGPKVVVDNHSKNYTSNAVVELTDENGSAIQEIDGYYIIPAKQVIVLKKRVVLPKLPKYSDGQPNYTPNTFDKSITWDIEDGITYSLCRHTTKEIAEQAPVYDSVHQGSMSHTVKK